MGPGWTRSSWLRHRCTFDETFGGSLGARLGPGRGVEAFGALGWEERAGSGLCARSVLPEAHGSHGQLPVTPLKGTGGSGHRARHPGCVPKSEKLSQEAAERGCLRGQILAAQQGPPAGRAPACPGVGEGASGYSRRYCTRSRRAGSKFPANSNIFGQIKL